jgi:predicted  nucleic acid-binding Zn-ribbon protein
MMQRITKEQIEFLVKLQQIEIDANRIQIRHDSVDHRIVALDAGLKDFEETIENEEAVISELNQKYKACETDVQMNLERIAKSKEKLRAVKTNKEYQSSLKEIDDLETINSKVEDEMLKFLDHIEDAEKKVRDVKAEYSKLAGQANAEKSAILDEAEQGKQQLVELNGSRDDVTRSIASELLDIFNQTKVKQKNGVAIVAVTDAVCNGCNMNIPPQMYNELHRFDRLQQCPYCQRIIYLDDQNRRSE